MYIFLEGAEENYGLFLNMGVPWVKSHRNISTTLFNSQLHFVAALPSFHSYFPAFQTWIIGILTIKLFLDLTRNIFIAISTAYPFILQRLFRCWAVLTVRGAMVRVISEIMCWQCRTLWDCPPQSSHRGQWLPVLSWPVQDSVFTCPLPRILS